MNLTIKVIHVAAAGWIHVSVGKGGGSWEGDWRNPNEVRVSEETAVVI